MVVAADVGHVAPTLAGGFLAALAADGIVADPSLRLLAATPAGTSPTPPPADPHELGVRHELAVSADERRRRGAWYTPAWLADDLVAQALPDAAAAGRGPIVDPACGGGAFLLAAAERLRILGWAPSAAVAQLRGLDVDPLAVAVSEAALWWWSARHGDPARPDVAVGDALLAPPGPPAGAVVGNPPFLGQLRASTAVDAERRRALRARYGDAVRAYTDPAWLFLRRAVDDVVPGGRVVLVQPQSLLAARDAGAVRADVDERARLVDLVLPDTAAFDADVAVCALVLERTDHACANDWTGPLADAAGVPRVVFAVGNDSATNRRDAPTLGGIADVHAGFRDEFYALAAATTEGGTGPRLITVGAIDPLTLLDRHQRFAGRRWRDPRVTVGALEGRAARWAGVQAGPKLLVATQTRVLEAVADPDGALLGSVPAIVVRPHDPADLWRLAAALHAPAASAWLLRRSAGSARSAGACRPTASLLAALPLPTDAAAWDLAADAAEAATRGDTPLAEVARLADAAYGLADEARLAWWDTRRPRRQP